MGNSITSHRHSGHRLLAYALVAAGCIVASTVARAADLPAPPGAAGRLIAHFQMKHIPQEGAWFSVTYTSEDLLDGATLPPRYAGRRHAAGGAIVVVVTPRDFSAMHRLTTDEVWHFYDGSALTIHAIDPDGNYSTTLVGRNLRAGEAPQAVVPAGWLFGATVNDTLSYTLVGCTVAPGFQFASIPALRMISCHFAVSAAMNRASSSGPDATGSAPCSTKRFATAGSFTASASART